MKKFSCTAALCALLLMGAALPARAAEPAPTPEPTLCLNQQMTCEEDGTYTLTLQAWAESGTAAAHGSDTQLRYTLAPEWTADTQTHIQVYAVDKTHSGWGQVKLDLPGLQLDPDTTTGTLTVTGFDYTTNAVSEKPRLDGRGRTTFGRKLVVRVSGLQPDYGATFGGCGIPAGTGGLYTAEQEGTQPVCLAAFPTAAADIPLRCTYAPADQTLTDQQEVNFGYMINPPGGNAGNLPDGSNNAWCTVQYTVSDQTGPVAEYTVPTATAMSGGCWTIWPSNSYHAPGRYTVTVTLCASGSPAQDLPTRGSARRLVLQTDAAAYKATP